MRALLYRQLLAFGASFLAIFFSFQLALEYALGSDSWYFLVYPEKLVTQHSMTARPVLAALQWLLNRAGLNIVALQFWDGLFGMAMLAIAMVLLQRALLQRALLDRAGGQLKSRLLAFLISFAIVSNPLLSEWFGNSFIVPPTCLSEILCIAAGILLAQPACGWKKLLLVFAMSICASGLFQSPMSLIVPIAVMLLALENACLSKILTRAGFGIAAWAAGGLSGYLYAKYIHPLFMVNAHLDRRVSAFHPLVNLKLVLADFKAIWIDSFMLIPKYVYISVLAAALLILIAAPVSRRLKAFLLASAALLIAMTLGIHLIAGGVWIVPRSVTSLCAPIGILLIPALRVVNRRLIFRAAVLLLAFWFAICVMASTRALSDYRANYELDSLEARLIYQQIARYEHKSGKRVNNVAFQFDKYPVWCYDAIRCSGDFNVRSWTKSFSRQPMLKVISGRDFKEVPFTLPLQDIFGIDNWDDFSPDQVKCLGDTAYIGIY